MCGVAFVHRPGATTDELETLVQRMNAAQRRRGPDAAGYVLGDEVAIGHTRLRVLDLDERADQPFGDARAQLSYNGEIYNHRELRAELARDGVRFRTESDTETLFEGLLAWGLAGLERVHGMFAFALWFPRERRLWMARDRVGIKPLHLCDLPNGLVVASEAKAILATGIPSPTLDGAAVLEVLRYNHPIGRRTAFADIETLEPGVAVTVDLATRAITRTRYYRPLVGGRGGGANELDEHFTAAMKSHLQADVPVACYMSSGIDSCGIAFEAQRVAPERLSVYSMVFPGASYCEGEAIDRVARGLTVPHHRMPIDAVTAADLHDYVWCAEMPQQWTSDLALKLLARRVSAAGGKVVLSGEGPDELLAGYDTYRAMKLRRLAERFGLTHLARSRIVRSATVGRLLPWLDFDMSVVSFYLARHAPRRRADLEARYGFYPENVATQEALTEHMAHLLTPARRASLPDVIAAEEAWFRCEVAPHCRGATTLDANVLFEVMVRLPRWILHMGDRMSAAHGLELRFPYLDDHVLGAMLALRPSDRLRAFEEKHILRKMHRRRVPREVLRRRKQPLHTPIRAWLAPLLGDPTIARHLSADAFERAGVFERAPSLELARRVESGAFASQLDGMVSEWALMTVLTTNMLAQQAEAHHGR